MSIYTKIDESTCISCNACCGEAPNVFEMGDVAFSVIDNNEGKVAVCDDEVENVISAKECCPVEAVLVSESAF